MCHQNRWYICFIAFGQSQAKKPKESLNNRTKTVVNTDKQARTEKNNEGKTRVTVAQLLLKNA
jgi:hypothetical protein